MLMLTREGPADFRPLGSNTAAELGDNPSASLGDSPYIRERGV